MDEKLQIFADLYARYDARNAEWMEDRIMAGHEAEHVTEGPWQEAMDGLLGYAEISHGLTASWIRRHAEKVEL